MPGLPAGQAEARRYRGQKEYRTESERIVTHLHYEEKAKKQQVSACRQAALKASANDTRFGMTTKNKTSACNREAQETSVEVS